MVELEVDSCDEIENIARRVANLFDLTQENVRLDFAGKLLENGRTLNDYNITNKYTLKVVKMERRTTNDVTSQVLDTPIVTSDPENQNDVGIASTLPPILEINNPFLTQMWSEPSIILDTVMINTTFGKEINSPSSKKVKLLLTHRDRTLSVKVNSSEFIRYIRTLVQRLFNLNMESFSVQCNGVVLNDNLTLEEYGLTDYKELIIISNSPFILKTPLIKAKRMISKIHLLEDNITYTIESSKTVSDLLKMISSSELWWNDDLMNPDYTLEMYPKEFQVSKCKNIFKGNNILIGVKNLEEDKTTHDNPSGGDNINFKNIIQLDFENRVREVIKSLPEKFSLHIPLNYLKTSECTFNNTIGPERDTISNLYRLHCRYILEMSQFSPGREIRELNLMWIQTLSEDVSIDYNLKIRVLDLYCDVIDLIHTSRIIVQSWNSQQRKLKFLVSHIFKLFIVIMSSLIAYLISKR